MPHRPTRLLLLGAILAILWLVLLAPKAHGATFGIADAQFAGTAYYQTPAFQTLKARLPLRRARFFVRWDACTVAGTASSRLTRAGVNAAHAQGFTVILALSIISYPPYPSDPGYTCGVRALLRRFPDVHEWTPINEPDAHRRYNGGTYCSDYGGPGFAARLWIRFRQLDTRPDFVVAGAFTNPSIPYLSDYQCVLRHHGRFPIRYSVHDYADVTNDGHLALPPWQSALARMYTSHGHAPPLTWVTEAGAILSARPFSTGTWLAGNPPAQYTAGARFLGLGGITRVTRAYWYQWQPANVSSGWDSGLLSAPAGGYASPDGEYSQLRESYCALARLPTSSCSNNPVDASPWSVNHG